MGAAQAVEKPRRKIAVLSGAMFWKSWCVRLASLGPCFQGLGEPRRSLRWWRCYLQTAGPRVVACRDPLPPLLLFTDGAVEDGGSTASIGGVLIDGLWSECFGVPVPHHVLAEWAEGVKVQTIGQAELAPAVVALLTWPQRLSGRRVLHLVDNEAAR